MSNARIRAMIRQYKRNPDATKRRIIESAIAGDMAIAEREKNVAEAEIKRLADLGDWLNTAPATVKPSWKMPAPPVVGYKPVAVLDGSEWSPQWDDGDDTIDWNGGDWWPFVESKAYAEDFEALGFRVEVA